MMNLPAQTFMNSKRHFEALKEGTKSQISVHSEGRAEVDLSASDKFFSFNQTFASIEQNDKMIQEKTTSLSKIKTLEEELKSYKSRSTLWEKAKSQIVFLNKYLKLSSISLGCSDSAIMKEFFQALNDLLLAKDDKTKDDKNKIAENKKKETELFEKLVESNKKKYELEQKLVHFEHQISKLTDVNESLREKSRVHSTENSSRIREFHEETLMTIHQKDSELSTLEDRNNELKLDLVRHEETVQSLKSELELKDHDLQWSRENNEELQIECQELKTQIARLRNEEQQTQMTFLTIKEELQKIVEENIYIRGELKKRGEEIMILKGLIEGANAVNDEFLNALQASVAAEDAKRQEKIDELLKKEEQLKNKLASIRFTARRKSSRFHQKFNNLDRGLQLPETQELLI